MFASRVAAFIKHETGITVKTDPGGKIGEFSVWADGTLVQKKDKFKFPDKYKILDAVKKELQR